MIRTRHCPARPDGRGDSTTRSRKTKNWAGCLPNRTVAFLSRDEVLEIHRVLLQQFGGPEGLRDPGLLESALYRPRTGYYADLAEMAAALFESLIMNHSFVDGKKRVAFFCHQRIPAPEWLQAEGGSKTGPSITDRVVGERSLQFR